MPWSWVNTKYIIHQIQHTPCTAYTKYSIQQVQYTPSTVNTVYSIHRRLSVFPSFSRLHIDSGCGFSSESASSQIDRQQPAFQDTSKVMWDSDSWELPKWWMQNYNPVHIPSTAFRSTTSKNYSNLDHSWLQSVSPNLIDYGLQVCINVASKCSSELTRLCHPRSLDHVLQLLLQTRSITASKCISILDWSLPPSASLHTLNHGLQVGTIMASKCISTLARSWPPSASHCSYDNGLEVYLWVHLIVIFRCTSNCSEAPPAASPDIPCVDG